jgi:hypothetical protein
MQATWTNAAAECCGMNMALLSVETSAEQTCISQMVEGIHIIIFNWDRTKDAVYNKILWANEILKYANFIYKHKCH